MVSILRNRQQVMLCNDYVNTTRDEVFIRVGNKMSATPFCRTDLSTVKQALLTIQNISQQKHVFDPTSLKKLKNRRA